MDAYDSYKYDPNVDMSGYVPLEKRFKQAKASEPVVLVKKSDSGGGFYSSEDDQKYKEYLESLGDQSEPETNEGDFDAFRLEAKNSVRFNVNVLKTSVEAQRFGYMRVGSGEQKDERCGKFMGHVGCLRVELHDKISLDGKDHSGKAYIKRVYHSCDRPECPICFKRWAVKEAGAAEERLKKISMGYVDDKRKKHMGLGQVEHVIVSCPKTDYDLVYEKLKVKALKAIRGRGFLGGFMIFHAERFANFREAQIKGVSYNWRYEPHFHFIGFIDGGYGRCRSCRIHRNRAECWHCDGFEGVTRRLNVSDGYIVKIAEDRFHRKLVRKSIFGTLYYQLNHATLIHCKVRFHVGTWVGVCSYIKMKLKVGDRKRKNVCPICQHDLISLRYVGVGEPNNGQWWIDDFEDDYLDWRGVPKWIENERSGRFHGH